MDGFKVANLDLLLEVTGEEGTKSILAGYSCPLNEDIEDFLHNKALVFAKQGLAKTHLVFASYKGDTVLVGYFALANKTLFIRRSASLSAKLRQRIKRFSRVLQDTNSYEISAPLIAQLGKNYANNYDSLITGDELLQIACNKIKDIQLLMGGKIAYLECEDKPRLLQFYERNGFVPFDKRPLDPGDRKVFKSDHLVQMIRYF